MNFYAKQHLSNEMHSTKKKIKSRQYAMRTHISYDDIAAAFYRLWGPIESD